MVILQDKSRKLLDKLHKTLDKQFSYQYNGSNKKITLKNYEGNKIFASVLRELLCGAKQ